jgi:hypothetical protein
MREELFLTMLRDCMLISSDLNSSSVRLLRGMADKDENIDVPTSAYRRSCNDGKMRVGL